MLLIRNPHELLAAFRPLDLRLFEMPDETSYPIFVRDYRAWIETGGARVYVVFEDPGSGRPVGIVFRRATTGGAAIVNRMCDWCHYVGSADEVGMLVAEYSTRRKLGVMLCRDLRCRERVEEAGDLAGRDTAEARRRVLERIARFAREGLGLTGT